MRIIPVTTPNDIARVRALLVEYQERLGVDLSFQDFDAEVRNLPGDYAPPAGRLLLALHAGTAVGCVALRAAGGTRGEMKRLFVRPGTRGLGVGRALVVRVLEEARAAGYVEMVLDTLPDMVEAQRLYTRFGFRDIPAYRPNPVEGTRYLGKSLVAE